jgi:hypothetical protein
MNYQDMLKLEYKIISANAPEVENPNLNKSLPLVEQLVSCKCFAKYRVWVNGSRPIADTKMLDIICPRCGTPASEFASLSGHSAGCFNASLHRMQADEATWESLGAGNDDNEPNQAYGSDE